MTTIEALSERVKKLESLPSLPKTKAVFVAKNEAIREEKNG